MDRDLTIAPFNRIQIVRKRRIPSVYGLNVALFPHQERVDPQKNADPSVP